MPGAGPSRIVLHAGFHKTGTTTVQTLLRLNRDLLSPHLLALQNADLRDLIQVTRSYSMWRDPISAADIASRLGTALDGAGPANGRCLLISAEEISGLLPGLPQRRGRPEVETYAAAPDLIALIAEALRSRFGAGPPIHVIYGTRAANPWLRSVYWQHVKVQRMEMDEDTFLARHRPAADLDGIVALVAARNPDLSVTRFRLEDHAVDPLGPAQPILGLCDLPAQVLAACTPAPPTNVAPPPEVLSAMLTLNRSGLDTDTLKARKKAMEAEVRAARRL